MSLAVSVKNATVNLGGEAILENINLEINHGEFIALIGPSGGGKSTMLRLIAGLISPSKGEILTSCNPALVFQDYRLLPWRTALQNVQLPQELGKVGGMSPISALHMVGMSSYANYFPRELSGGMQARVALARALAQNSNIILLDEPFAALDAMVRERFNEELRHLHDKTGHTTVLVTHSIREAVWLADKVAVLRDGLIVEVLDTKGKGRVSAYTEGAEKHLRDLLGTGDSTRLKSEKRVIPSYSKLLPALALVAGLVIWQLSAVRINQALILPSPMAVLGKYSSSSLELWQALAVTAKTMLLGTFFGGLAGMLLGYPIAKSVALERFLSPFIVISQSTPIVIIAPLLVLWLGFGMLPAVIVSALSALYPLMISCMVGIREIDQSYHELFCNLKATPLQRLRLLELPGALPVMLGGLRLSASLALIGAVVWEFTDPNQKGIGLMVQQAGITYDKALQFAAITVLVLFGVLLYAIITALEKRVMQTRGR